MSFEDNKYGILRMYQKKSYRNIFSNELTMFDVCVGQTDLQIGCDLDLTSRSLALVRNSRHIISNHIKNHPEFETTLEPVMNDDSYPVLIQQMILSGIAAGTGPMAAVAGAVAQYVGNGLESESVQVFVENGGDIYFNSGRDRKIGIFAGDSPLSNKLAIKLPADGFPVGICTSSGTVGHSFSFGRADAVTVISKDTALADAVATAACNRIKKAQDIESALRFAMNISEISGIVAIMGETVGALGNIELAKVSNQG